MLSGLQIFGSTQLSLGALQLRIGMEGMLSIVIPIIVGLTGVLIWFMPVHRVFYGVIGMVVALFSLVAVNLGGFFIGMFLGILGGSFAIGWTPRDDDAPLDDDTGLDDGAEGPDEIVDLDDLMEDEYPVSPSHIYRRDDPPAVQHRDSQQGKVTVQLAVAGGLFAALVAAAGMIPALAGQSAQLSSADDTCDGGDDDAGVAVLVTDTAREIVDQVLPSGNAAPTSDEPTSDPTGDPTEESTSEPTDEPSPEPTEEPTSEPTREPTPTSEPTSSPEPTDEPSTDPEPEPCEPPDDDPTGPPSEEQPPEDEPSDDEPSEGEGGLADEENWPEGAVATEKRDTTLALPDDVVVGDPSRMRADQIVMHNLEYQGNVCVPKVDGTCIESMWFTLDKGELTNALGETPARDGGVTEYSAPDLTWDGNVHLYSPRFVGWLLGFKITFTPETPPPFTLPILIFSDVDFQISYNTADVLTSGETPLTVVQRDEPSP